MAVSTLYVGVTCCFMATPIGIGYLCRSAAYTILINLAFRMTCVFFAYQSLLFEKSGRVKPQKACAYMASAMNYLVPLMFSFFDSITRDVVIHEMGHALMAKSIYLLNAFPTIKIFQSSLATKGLTEVSIKGFTALGNALGSNNCQRLLCAAGAATVIFFHVIHLRVAEYIKKQHPEISRYLNAIALTSIVSHVFYALSAFWTSGEAIYGHDFYQLKQLGINPVVAAIGIIAIPLIGSLWNYFRKETTLPQEQEGLTPIFG